MELNERISLFRDMVLSCHDLYLWIFDPQMNLVQSNCPEAALLYELADQAYKEKILLAADKYTKPVLMSNEIGLSWITVPCQPEDTETQIYILGPFSVADISVHSIEKAIHRYRLSADVQKRSVQFLASVPVLSQGRVFEYAIMLYYCITQKKILVSDLHYQDNMSGPAGSEWNRPKKADIHGTYAMEQEMVRMVREGNLNYQKQISRLAVSGNIGKLSNDSSRQLKNAVLVCIVLFSRAAIEGGLSPETAMTLTDHYFQSVESCKNMQELQMIARTMQDDFVQRVHKARTVKLSPAIRECCDYLDLHSEEELTLQQIASRLGYSEYYLSHKFHQEMGVSFRDYLTKTRLSKAPDLLRNNALSIKDVSERLNFCSPSYFAEQFKAVYGVSPSEWRKNL